MVHNCNPSTMNTEVGGLLHWLYSKILIQNQTNGNKNDYLINLISSCNERQGSTDAVIKKALTHNA